MASFSLDELYEAMKEAKPENAEKASEDPEKFPNQAAVELCMLLKTMKTMFMGEVVRLRESFDGELCLRFDGAAEEFNEFLSSPEPGGKTMSALVMDTIQHAKNNPPKSPEEMMVHMYTEMMTSMGKPPPTGGSETLFTKMYEALKEAKPHLVDKMGVLDMHQAMDLLGRFLADTWGISCDQMPGIMMFVLDPSSFAEGERNYNMLTFQDFHIKAMEVIEAMKSSSAVTFEDIQSELNQKMQEKMAEKKDEPVNSIEGDAGKVQGA